MKAKNKQKLSLFIVTLILLMSAFSVIPYADSSVEEDETKIRQGYGEYKSSDEELTDVLEKFSKEDIKEIEKNRNNIKFVLMRIFTPQYINRAPDAVVKSGAKDPRYNGVDLCNPNAPQNLLSHNCNVPNVAAEFLQNIVSTFEPSAINGGKRTSAEAVFGLGVPTGIPGGKVPIRESDRTHTYTALELYGYNLHTTRYFGEWDKINVSTQARMLSNFGFIDTVRLTGSSMLNGLKSGVGALISDLSWNPITNIGNFVSGAAGSAFNTIIDTHDLNIFIDDSWSRPSFNDTLYNVHILSDKDVIVEAQVQVAERYSKMFSEAATADPTLQEVLALEHLPSFEFIPNVETEESVDAREAAEKNNSGSNPTIPVPEPVYETESVQFKKWIEEHRDLLDTGEELNIIANVDENYTNYEALKAKWTLGWQEYSAKMLQASSGAVLAVIDKVSESMNDWLTGGNPYLDPKTPISHYVCATPDGDPIRNDDGSYRYLYTKKNEGSREFVNTECSEVRPSIGGALFGNGHLTKTNIDTRYEKHAEGSIATIAGHFLSSLVTSGTRAITNLTTMLTNEVINISFSPITSTLGIDDMVADIVSSLRDTVFFPLMGLMAVIGMLVIMYQALMSGSIMQSLRTVIQSVLLFMLAVILIFRPEQTIRVAEAVPDYIDNIILSAGMSGSDGGGLCAATSEDSVLIGARAAQCSIWQANIFNPWVHSQFGTGYDNLYAKGYAPAGKNEMKNENENLVGNASVDMGGGHTVNNWALYQLSEMKSGTITSKDSAGKNGYISPNLYRLVDLQAGPNNASLSDTRYFDDWAAGTVGVGSSLLTLALSIFIFFVVVPLGLIKIESSILMLFYILGIPIMALRMFSEKGNRKVVEHFSLMAGLIYRRAMSAMLLTIALRTITAITSSGGDYNSMAILAMAVAGAFILYRKELMNKLGLASSAQSQEHMSMITSQAKSMVPKSIQQAAYQTYAGVRGGLAGAVGGLASGLQLSSLERKLKAKSEAKGVEYVPTTKKKPFDYMLEGYEHSSSSRERIAYRQSRRSGLGILQNITDAKEEVYSQGADEIIDAKDIVAYDTAREIISETSRGNSYKATRETMTSTDNKLVSDPRIQRAIREAAKERREALEGYKSGEDVKIDFNKEAAAKILDERRRNVLIKDALANPTQIISSAKDLYKEVDKTPKVKYKMEDIKEELKAKYEEEQDEINKKD